MQYEESARKMLDVYLQKVKAYLGAASTADPDDVARDVTEHIENELGETNQPVTAGCLEVVLHRLGEPSKWVDENDLPWWRKFLFRARGGPESWRLAYITFGLIVFGFLISIMSSEEYFFVFLAMSFITARASLSVAGDPKCIPGEQKWLTYPPLVAVYGFIVFRLLILGIVGLFQKPRKFLAAVFYPFLNPARRQVSLWILILAGFVVLLSVTLITTTMLNAKPV